MNDPVVRQAGPAVRRDRPCQVGSVTSAGLGEKRGRYRWGRQRVGASRDGGSDSDRIEVAADFLGIVAIRDRKLPAGAI